MAGKFLYGDLSFDLLNNAIDASAYSFTPEIRAEKRKELGLDEDAFVIGSVARFCPQKNHAFIIRAFAETLKLVPAALLMLVGAGPLLAEIKALAQKLGIADKVLFMGLRSDVPALLQAFDVFFMPSLFEGLPVSVIEAQAAGLPVVLADTIDPETDITGNLIFDSLDSPLTVWAEKLAECQHISRAETFQQIVANGYDIHGNLKMLLPLYGISE